MFHGRPSMMLGAGKPRLWSNDTIILKDDRRCAAASPLPHLVCLGVQTLVSQSAEVVLHSGFVQFGILAKQTTANPGDEALHPVLHSI
jgi:hypothetical protein